MSPPAIVTSVIRPCILIMELEKVIVRTVLADIGSRFIACFTTVDFFTIQPFIKGTAMIKYSIQDDTDAPLVCFLYQRCKKFIACLQIPFIRHAGDIAAGMLVIAVTRL